MFAGFTERLNFGMGGGTVSIPSAFPTRPIGQLGNFNTFAVNFITAAGITDPTQQSAINQLATGLVVNGLMDKLVAIYPFVGGTASTHAYNLKDPRNLDAAFRLTFSGGITHSSSGVWFNGSNGFANTFWVPPLYFNNNMSFALYSTQNIVGGSFPVDIGTGQNTSSGVPGQGAYIRRSGNDCLGSFTSWTVAGSVTGTVTDARGLYVFTITANNLRRIYRNGSILATSTTTLDQNVYPQATYIGCGNYAGTAALFSFREFAFVSIGFGLNETDNALLYNIIQAYQQTLNRSV